MSGDMQGCERSFQPSAFRGEQVAKLMQTASHPRFHGPQGFIQPVGDLRLGMPGCEEIDHDALRFREFGHRPANPFLAYAFPGLVSGIWLD